MTVRITKNTIDLKGLGELDAQRVDVGFLAGATYPDGTPVSLVAAVNEFGTSDGSIPERPFMRNALRNARKAVLDAVADGIRDSDDASIDGGTAAKAGEVLAGAIPVSYTHLTLPTICSV